MFRVLVVCALVAAGLAGVSVESVPFRAPNGRYSRRNMARAHAYGSPYLPSDATPESPFTPRVPELWDGSDSSSLPAGLRLHNVVAEWAVAQDRCAAEGGVIASPINRSVYNAMKSIINVKDTTFYIGARVADMSGRFMSLEGVSLEDMTAAMVDMSPHLEPLDGDCVAMNRDTMHVVSCFTRLPYMCRPNVTPVSLDHDNITTTMVNATSTMVNATSAMVNATSAMGNGTNCAEGYKYYHLTRKCYRLHRTRATWDDAKITCSEEGGYLVVIESADEASHIMDMWQRRSDDWLLVGLRKSVNSDDWTSVRGEPESKLYNVWRSSYDRIRWDCGSIHSSGTLCSWSCNDLLNFVCQMQPRL